MGTEFIKAQERALAQSDTYPDEYRSFMQHLLISANVINDGQPEPGWMYANYPSAIIDLSTGPRIASLALPPGYDEMEMGECYSNAMELAMGGDDDLIYVEGFAQSSFIPLEHAWIERRSDGLIIDPTWQPDSWGSEAIYLGIKFDTAFALKRRLQYGWTSILGGDDIAGDNVILRRGLQTNDENIAYAFRETT